MAMVRKCHKFEVGGVYHADFWHRNPKLDWRAPVKVTRLGPEVATKYWEDNEQANLCGTILDRCGFERCARERKLRAASSGRHGATVGLRNTSKPSACCPAPPAAGSEPKTIKDATKARALCFGAFACFSLVCFDGGEERGNKARVFRFQRALALESCGRSPSRS